MQLPWATSVLGDSRATGQPAGGFFAPPAGYRPFRAGSGGALRLEDLVEYQLAALDAVGAVVGQRGVAVLVDRVLPEDRVAVLDLEEGVDDRLAVVALVAGVLDRQQGDLHRLVAVDRVRLGVRAVLGLVGLEEVLRGRRVQLRIQRRIRDEGLLLDGRAELRRERGLRDAVGPEELRRRVGSVDVGEDLHALVLGDAAEEHAVGAGRLDLRGERAEVRGLRVDAVVAEHLEALRLGDVGHLVGDALPVDLLVVEDVELRAALTLLVGHLGRRLDVVGGHDAAEGALAGRVVLVRLALVRALGAGQADVRVRRGDLQDAGLVGDRQGDRRRARVELTQVRDGRRVLRRLAGVGRSLARLPLARRRRGVVEALVGDLELADLAAGLLERQLLAVDDGLGLRAGVALQRQARIDGQRGAATAATTAAAAPAVVVAAAARGDTEGKGGRQAAGGCH